MTQQLGSTVLHTEWRFEQDERYAPDPKKRPSKAASAAAAAAAPRPIFVEQVERKAARLPASSEVKVVRGTRGRRRSAAEEAAESSAAIAAASASAAAVSYPLNLFDRGTGALVYKYLYAEGANLRFVRFAL